MYDLIVIGAGPGGYEAAAHAVRKGKRVALVEKDRLGGTCLNTGCIPTKTLLRSSRLFLEVKNAACYGVRVREAAFDLPVVIERKDRLVGVLRRGIESRLKRAGVQVLEGHARLASRRAVAVDGRSYETANILIATGSRPLRAIGNALDSTAALALREAPRSLAIAGGGYIGLEFASFFAAIGTAVTVYEALPQIGGGLDRDIAARLESALRKAGVVIRTSCPANAVEGAERILDTTGRAPVVEDLGLEEVGIDFDARGIRTSEEGRTNVPGIWACGDVTGRRMLAHAATRQGIVAVNNMFGRRDRVRYHAIPSVIYTHPEVACVGWTEQELQTQGVAYSKSIVPMALAGRFPVEHEGAQGVIKVLAGAPHGEILGVHAIGDGASEFIATAAAMIETEMCASAAEELVFPHPTVSEVLKAAIARLGE